MLLCERRELGAGSMSGRCVVNVATGRYIKGQDRLGRILGPELPFLSWTSTEEVGSPSHSARPYAFKAFAMKLAEKSGFRQILWADACIVLGPSPLERIWEQARENGVWLSRNGYRNSEWTANSAYPALGVSFEENYQIEHVVATTFAVDLDHPVGRKFLDEYFRLASETDAFCGPWTGGIGVQHRHDQTAASVIAWRLGVSLTNPPDFFAYRKPSGECADPETVLIADGSY